MRRRTYAETKIIVGVIVILGYSLFALTGATFFMFGALSELDLAVISSPFVTFAPAAKMMFDSLAFGDQDALIYQFTDRQLVTFFDSLYEEIDHSIDPSDCVVINAKNFFRLHQDILFELRQQMGEDHLKYYPETLFKRYEKLFLQHSTTYKGIVSRERFDYLIKKVLDWIQGFPTKSPKQLLSRTAFRLIVFAAIAHPTVGILLLWFRAFGVLNVETPTLATVAAIVSTIFAGFWTSTMSKFGAGDGG